MRVLVLGATGLLGHRLLRTFCDRFEAWGTVRSEDQARRLQAMCGPRAQVLPKVDALRFETIERALDSAAPTAVVNCIGIVKQHAQGKDPIASTKVNALLPHELHAACVARGIRFLHISTDCVFSGRKGNYAETDLADPPDVYGRSKLLGEVADGGALTIRTSIVGPDPFSRSGLLEWLLANEGQRIPGYARATFSGLGTPTLARILAGVLEHHGGLRGLYHVASRPVTKLELLSRVSKALGLSVTIEPSGDLVLDRSLDGSRFEAATGIVVPTWDQMIGEMVPDLRERMEADGIAG